MKGQIIWTREELEAWCIKRPPWALPPLAIIHAPNLHSVEIVEVSTVQGMIYSVIISFPPRTAGLVRVSISLNGKTLAGLSQDDFRYSFLLADRIHRGDVVKVIVENTDPKFSHQIGVRVDVDTKRMKQVGQKAKSLVS